MSFYNNAPSQDFNAIAVTIASPDQILKWSHGEVVKPETINYRTQKPERDGLFCEKLFGPIKNWECSCGKYKRVRYKGVVCERCGVEVTRAVVRRERMAHIDLAVPVSHIWYLRSTPSRIGLMLDLPVKLLEQIVYFSLYIITEVDQDEKTEAQQELEKDFEEYSRKLKEELKTERMDAEKLVKKGDMTEKQFGKIEAEHVERIEEMEAAHQNNRESLESLEIGQVVTELEYRDLSMKFGHVFVSGTGAEALRTILERIDLEVYIAALKEEMAHSSGQKQKKLLKRIRLAASLHRSGIRPEWMILTRLPVLPPDLRPMIQLDGGRFAASDLNDLYRRVINRNNRLKRLLQLGAPEVICRNEKRMLQEAVDTLLNNSPRAGRSGFTAGDKRKLKSLSDMLKGKQGRFRQNLLGKRVDYSGRSVIVVGPELFIYQCGLPKTMALRLFKPFVIGELIRGEYAFNVKGAERLITENKKIVWDMLDKVIRGRYVLLNRAPTLHRLGIQAFEPVLVEGKSIKLHPLVCSAFNADFDGDQMAVHLPLSDQAQAEARDLICARHNILKPSSGQPVITPSQDMILGIYFLTAMHDGLKGEGTVFKDLSEAINVYRLGGVNLQARVKIRVNTGSELEMEETSVGRAIFNSFIPVEAIGFKNKIFKKKDVSDLFAEVFYKTGAERTIIFADDMKRVGFKFATQSGLTMSAFDLKIPKGKAKTIEASESLIKQINNYYERGVITDDERYVNTIKVWAKAKNEVSAEMIKNYEKDPLNQIYYMVDSGARGNWGQITQLSGMKGLVANPGGKTIELPIKSNLLEGFTILEYFNATHGGRKGKSDTALKTAQAGYLTRRLVDAVHDIIIKEYDCETKEGVEVTRAISEKIGEEFSVKIYGRTLRQDIVTKSGEVIGKIGDAIERDMILKVEEHNIDNILVRSIISCKTELGICQKCYGRDLAYDKDVKIGTPVGIIAAQAIGEPGTQLTMRTFHSGGVADGADITQGLPRVEELFEARSPKTPAVLSEIEGGVKVLVSPEGVEVHVEAKDFGLNVYKLEGMFESVVKKGEEVFAKKILAKSNISKDNIRVKIDGVVEKVTDVEVIVRHKEKQSRVYSFRHNDALKVSDGDYVESGQALSAGHYNLRELIDITGVLAAEEYIIHEVQKIYASQGQSINDKHIEIIVKQMFSKIKIVDSGESNFLPGEVIDFQCFTAENTKLIAQEKRVSSGERLVLGLSRVSLATDSWLSAASFQETVRVLVESSIVRKVDKLKGLKENVILGRLINAGHIYRERQEDLKKAEAPEVVAEDLAQVQEDSDLITGKIL
ncbi:DNA-directed RNA polymerase subunit beta' [Candidatus Peregrinibacteria bacterium]|nr:MAG: DNA-directed RNA polymerase subunit beta' [Candidatus Peregrinibacteria bacterium]